MRLLHPRPDHVGRGAGRGRTCRLGRRHSRIHERQHLPLRRLQQYRRCRAIGSKTPGGGAGVMHPFRYARLADLAAALTAAKDPTAEFLAGGTDMLQLLKDDIRRPARLLDLGGIAELQGIEAGPSGLRLGALARMSDVAEHPVVKAEYHVLSQALLASASPQ